MKILVSCLVLFASLSSVAFANRESGGRIGASAVYVDFRSLGSGIDLDSAEVLEVLIKAAASRGEVAGETSGQVGREGEFLRCVLLNDAAQRLSLIQSLKFSIERDRATLGAVRTAVYVGFDCQNFANATEQDLSKY